MTNTRRMFSAAVVALAIAAASCGDGDGPTAPSTPRAEYSQTDLRTGTGAEATNGMRLVVNYAGWLYNTAGPDGKGQLFDTSIGRGPFQFVLGNRDVIPGWDQGVPGMKVGGVRRLFLPPELAYGTTGSAPSIPPNASLVFEIELLDVQ